MPIKSELCIIPAEAIPTIQAPIMLGKKYICMVLNLPYVRYVTKFLATTRSGMFSNACLTLINCTNNGLAGAVANVTDSGRCNPKVPSSIHAGSKEFP